jgi:membrane-associated phospholipid phosphatase
VNYWEIIADDLSKAARSWGCVSRRRVGLAYLPIPILIGSQPMYIGVHYLSDVVCAANRQSKVET